MVGLIKMKTANILNKLPLILSFLFFGLLSCGDEYFFDDVDCSQCYVPKPEFGPVKVSVTMNSENTRIPIKIFKGKYEEAFLKNYESAVIIDTLSVSSIEYNLDVNEYYSVAVEYIQNGEKVIVVDGDKLKMYKVSDSCDEVCWIFKGGDIDATLKK